MRRPSPKRWLILQLGIIDEKPGQGPYFPERLALVLWLCASGWLSACGAAPPAGRARVAQAVAVTAQGIRVETLARPTPGLVQLALWVDAGSRDASPPQLAAVAAWIAGERAGRAVIAIVTPDGIELSYRCPTRSIRSCLGQLKVALATRDIRDAQVAKAMARLMVARQQTHLADPGRTADQLALSALFGPQAEGFFPLGDAQVDHAVTAKAVRDFFNHHFGPARALLLAVGDLGEEDIADIVQEVFQDIPSATQSRAKRQLGRAASGVKTSLDTLSILSVAALCPTLDRAVSLARHLGRAASFAAPSSGPSSNGYAVPIRGGVLAMARTTTADPVRAVRATSFEYARLKEEELTPVTAPPPPDGLAQLARQSGVAWCTSGASEMTDPIGPGLGVLVNSGRVSAKPVDERPDEERGDKIREQLEAAFTEGSRQASEVGVTGEVGADFATVTAGNGARIEIMRRDGARLAIAVTLAGGAAFDPAALHGRSALLTTLATTACRAWPGTYLGTKLESFGASLEPLIDGQAWGVLLSAPVSTWRDALDVALECALHPSLTALDIVRARTKLREDFGTEGSARWFSNQVAQLLSSTNPGRIAPWGTPASAANVSDSELTKYAVQSIVGARLRVAAVGDVPVKEMIARMARRVGGIPKGTLPQKLASDVSKRKLTAPLPCPDGESEQVWAIAVWQTARFIDAREGASAFRALMAAALQGQGGIKVVWGDAGGDSGGSWAALGLKVPRNAAASLELILKRTAEAAAKSAYDEAVERLSRQAIMLESEAGARVDVEAARRAQQRQDPKKLRSLQQIREVARDLVTSRALWAFFGPVS